MQPHQKGNKSEGWQEIDEQHDVGKIEGDELECHSAEDAEPTAYGRRRRKSRRSAGQTMDFFKPLVAEHQLGLYCLD